jgi:peptidoglycan biosynthesis protein MviN/MurJ (putative lipid II flippase)
MALLAGMFIVPIVLLWLGHRLRRRSDRSRGVFWGAVAGHTLGLLASVAAMHVPAVPWAGGDARTTIVHWGMLIGAVAGGATGWMVGARRGESATRHG